MNVKPHGKLVAVLLALAFAAPVSAQATATDYTGAEALGLALRRIGTTARVLMIGAHPDDENTSVLAALALGRGADVGYLSLTRGDGGQNLIGPELKEGLGLIRTDELLAARGIDGARQFFSRAYDYGYSKSADEAFRHWPRDSLIEDAVAVIRRFRPDVILSVWNGTPVDGHGQHQAAGIVAREAFRAAADPARYPGQIADGLRAHQAAYLLQTTWRQADDVLFTISTGDFDPLFGRSWYQISMASRSQHSSQDQGSAQPPGPQRTSVVPLGGARPDSLFAGVPTTLPDLAGALGASAGLVDVLEKWQSEVDRARRNYNALRPAGLIDPLSAAFSALEASATMADSEGLPELSFRIYAERSEVEEALRLAAGLVLDATAEDDAVVPGQEFEVTLSVWNGGDAPVTVERLEPVLPRGWRSAAVSNSPSTLAPGELASRRFRVTVPEQPDFSEPYYLEAPRRGDMYVWPADAMLRGLPFAAPPVRAAATIDVGSTALPLESNVVRVEVDKATGERRFPLLVVPAANVRVEPAITVVPLAAATDGGAVPPARPVSVTITAEAPAGVAGSVRLKAPQGWTVEPASIPVRIGTEGERETVAFLVTPPVAVSPGRHAVRASFEAEGGRTFDRGWTRILYPHTQPRLLFADAASTFSVFPVAIAEGLRVGYIAGAGDDAAVALRQMGVTVEELAPETLLSGDLDRYDVIVSGIRAYEVRPDIVQANDRLLAWVEAGGTFIAQYNKQEFVRGGFAPYPLEIRQSADRVTDETSPVRILEPEHPSMSRPNRIGASDFEGWVQERGLYFPSAWDEHWTPLLEMNDPGEAPLRGSLLVTQYGAGTYVYLTLSFFRQLPEGVPGAYRILANLVSLGSS